MRDVRSFARAYAPMHDARRCSGRNLAHGCYHLCRVYWRRPPRRCRSRHFAGDVRDPVAHQVVRRTVSRHVDERSDPIDLLLAAWPRLHQRRMGRAPSLRRLRRHHLSRAARSSRQGSAGARAVGRVPWTLDRNMQGQRRPHAHHPSRVWADGHHRHRRLRNTHRQWLRFGCPARRNRSGLRGQLR